MSIQRPPLARRTGAFTLTELLVVIVIIAVLTAVLLPVVNSVVENSRSASCSSRMRQLCAAIQSYRSDHDGSLPPNFAHSGGDISQCWVPLIRPYYGINDTSRNAGAVAAFAPNLTCPSATKDDRPALWYDSNFAVSLAFGTDGVPRKLNSTSLSGTVMLVESTNKERAIFTSPVPWSSIAYRHNLQTHLVFFDGHQESRVAKDIPQDNVYLSTFWGHAF